jgi:hypothetical protein
MPLIVEKEIESYEYYLTNYLILSSLRLME